MIVLLLFFSVIIALMILYPVWGILGFLRFLLEKLIFRQAHDQKNDDHLFALSFIVSILLTFCILLSLNNQNTSTTGNVRDASVTSNSSNYNNYTRYDPPPTIHIEAPDISHILEMPALKEDSLSTTNTPIAFVTYPESAHRNENVTVTIKGKPCTNYSIEVTYSSGPSTAEGLHPKESNADGYVSWTWKIGGRTSFGSYPIKVSGGGADETVYFQVAE